MLDKWQKHQIHEVLTSIPRHLVRRTSWRRLIREPKKCVTYLFGPVLYSYAKRTQRSSELSLKTVLANLIQLISAKSSFVPIDQWIKEESLEKFHQREEAERLGDLFTQLGSDKGRQGYAPIYQVIINSIREKNPQTSLTIVEIGLGSSDPRIPSNMGVFGTPGASLRAFRDFVASAMIIGGDIDPSSFFQEERIATSYVNQLDQPSIATFLNQTNGFDLLIDDGLHELDANLNVLCVGINHSRVGTWIVVEDIDPKFSQEWLAVAELLSEQFLCWLIQSNQALVFAATRYS